MAKDRAYYLLSVLEGTAPVLPRDSSIQFSPEVVISQFIKAYYSGDKDEVKQFLSDSHSGNVDVYTDYESADPAIHAIKGLDNLVPDMAYWGEIYPSVEFKISHNSDYYLYLSMTLTWEDNQWKVSEYGLEG